MENLPMINEGNHSEKMEGNISGPGGSHATNILLNHDFSDGLKDWHPNCCYGYVVSVESGPQKEMTMESDGNYAVITERKKCWQGLEQDITDKISVGSTYMVSAFVGVYGRTPKSTHVKATLKLEHHDSGTSYLEIGGTSCVKGSWEKLEGSFSLSTMPDRVIFYLEGPSPGVDLLIKSVNITCSSPNDYEHTKMEGNISGPGGSHATNILLNHDFSDGLNDWHPNCCYGYVVSVESGPQKEMTMESDGNYAVITERKKCWQGLEQDITDKISVGSTYMVSAFVGVYGRTPKSTHVKATLKLEHHDSGTSYLEIGGTSCVKGSWEKLEGSFSLSTMPDRVIFYLEGPSPGVDLLIKSVNITCSSPNDYEHTKMEGNISGPGGSHATNILLNHDFSDGLNDWHPNCCYGYVVSVESGPQKEMTMESDGNYAVITERKKCWQGLEQDITDKISVGSTYMVSAFVGVYGRTPKSTHVKATLKLEHHDSGTSYLEIGGTSCVKGSWEKLEGSFSLSTMPDRVIFYLEGPSPGVDLLIKSVNITCSSPNDYEHTKIINKGCVSTEDENIIINPQFDDGLNNWSGRGCKIALHDSMGDGKILPKSGKFFASATERTQSWNGIQQDITGRVQRKLAYEVTVLVRIFGNNVTTSDVRATLWVQAPDLREQYIGIANVQATDKDWVQMQGKFLLNGSPSKVVVYLEGPPPGTDILVNTLVIKHAAKTPPSTPPDCEIAAFGVNIIENSNLGNGTNGWFPLGSCTLSVQSGSPRIIPPMARDSLGPHESLSGRYLLVTNRTQTWMGPAQMITDKFKLFLTYQVSAWVRIGSGSTGPQNVNVALSVDNQWVNGGQVEIADGRWHEISGSFRIEKQASKVMVYIQGPASGVDLMIAGLQIFAVDRQARFKYLRRQTDKIRKRDITLKFSGLDSIGNLGTLVRVRQIQNDFPIGTCISRTNIDNEDFVDFFVKHFNWAVFGNELKWYWTEPQQGSLNYKDADEMLDLCQKNKIDTRGHCIFWEVDGNVQQWIKSLNKTDLMKAVQNRLNDLLTRYKAKFRHYDVNNEMLHGSFYQDRLGKDIRANMFKTAHQLDPSATLFVNDYHVEDGCDTRSSPEKYIQHILDLQQQGAPVGGIGIQGHIDSPVGPIVCSALDKLGTLGIPIWFTELDVSSSNEYVRADDLEVMLRETMAHPAIDGVMLWGFWELFMSRENSHLVDAEGELNEAGKRFLALKQEWLSHSHGYADAQGQFSFRGFSGTYNVEVVTLAEKVSKTFAVDKGDSSLVVSIDL